MLLKSFLAHCRKKLHNYQLGGEKNYKKVEARLNFFNRYGCKKKYWMQLPKMGPLFATAFNCVFCVFSLLQSCTYLSLRNRRISEFKLFLLFFMTSIISWKFSSNKMHYFHELCQIGTKYGMKMPPYGRSWYKLSLMIGKLILVVHNAWS